MPNIHYYVATRVDPSASPIHILPTTFGIPNNSLIFVSDYSLIMTAKQQAILNAALQLFAREGYASTSTSKVAKTAGVSEGLIFRHFGNKQGLLEAILEQGREHAQQAFAKVVMEPNPKKRIAKALEVPYTINQADYELWRLIYAIKWQTQQYDNSMYDPVRLVLKDAFTQLGYTDPEAETELLLMYLDGMATALLLHEPDNKVAILEALKRKYDL